MVRSYLKPLRDIPTRRATLQFWCEYTLYNNRHCVLICSDAPVGVRAPRQVYEDVPPCTDEKLDVILTDVNDYSTPRSTPFCRWLSSYLTVLPDWFIEKERDKCDDPFFQLFYLEGWGWGKGCFIFNLMYSHFSCCFLYRVKYYLW